MLKPRKLILPGILIICAMSLPYAIAQTSRVGGEKAGKVAGQSTEISQVYTKYTVRAYDERIAVFIEDSEEPAEVLDVYLFSLPPADAEILEEGITVYGDENLARVIEDYTS